MESSVQTKSRKPFYIWIAIVGVPIWAATFLILMWQYLNPPPFGGARLLAIMVIFGVAAVVCVALVLRYFLLPKRRGHYATNRVGAGIGGLTSMSLTVPVFGPVIEFQRHLMREAMEAFSLPLPLIGEWREIMFPYGACIEIVLIGMAAGWIFVVVGSWLKGRRI